MDKVEKNHENNPCLILTKRSVEKKMENLAIISEMFKKKFHPKSCH